LTSPSDPLGIRSGVIASFYDGRQSTRHSVTVNLENRMVVVLGDGIERREPIESVEITEPVGSAPRLVRFRDGALCEIEDPDALQAMLEMHGIARHRVTQWEGSLRWVVVAGLFFIVALAIGYRYLLPTIAGVVADRVPDRFIDVICSQVMRALDDSVFDLSELPSETQWRLTSAFGHLKLPGADPEAYRIMFRKSEALGPNALAIPSGEIVVTDALVGLAKADEEVLAVLAHEAGHVARRHGLRQLFQNSVIALAVTWFLGDISALAAAAPTALLQAKYSRDFEREADAYALEVLRTNKISPDYFARVLERVETAAGGRVESNRALAYLSSHPITAERIERVRSGN
jgi:Zn-dependent protease with chaperone function